LKLIERHAQFMRGFPNLLGLRIDALTISRGGCLFLEQFLPLHCQSFSKIVDIEEILETQIITK
jgi:hypothetical protein